MPICCDHSRAASTITGRESSQTSRKPTSRIVSRGKVANGVARPALRVASCIVVKMPVPYAIAALIALTAFLLGRFTADRTEISSAHETVPVALTHATQGPESATAVADTARDRTERAATLDWFRSHILQLESAVENQPTPGITEAILSALLEEGPFDQTRMLFLIETMRKEDFPVALKILRSAKSTINSTSLGFQGPPVWIAFWQRFGERDPATALATALECGDLNYPNRKLLEKHLFTGMARNNPRAAAEALLAHPELPNRPNAAEGLIFGWARADSNAACEWARENLEGDARKLAFVAAAWSVSTLHDISGANAFVQSLPEGPDRASAVTSVKNQALNKSYLPNHQIFDFVETTRTLDARDRKFEAQVAARCARTDPSGSANFFAQPVASGEANDFAELRIVMAQWVRQDAGAAENWLKGQENTPHYESVASEFARAAQEANNEPETRRWLDAIAARRKDQSQP